MTAGMGADEDLLRAVVAIPAKNEQRSLAACLEALASQCDARGRPLPRGVFGVVLLLNNCDDDSARVARVIANSFPAPLRIVECELPPQASHAGGARRAAMEMGAAWLEASDPDGLLLTTDADSRVGPTWIVDNLADAEAGADAIAGGIALDPEDERALPDVLRERGKLESIYEAQLIEIAARLDPRPHNPWPHHGTMSGASLAVKLSSYRRIGGLPALPLGEDKGLIAALEAHDARVRFAPDIRVVTSGRLRGRAEGGVADTIRLRCEDPSALCDESLEPARVAALRARWRGRLRRLHCEGRLGKTQVWARRLGIERFDVIGGGLAYFGAFWNDIERISPKLRRQRLRPSELPEQIRRAALILAKMRRSSVPRDHVEAISLRSLPPDDLGETADFGEKDFAGVVA